MSLQATCKALADPIRREILNLLKNRRLSAGEIGSYFPVTAASISRHLSVLREADLIRDTREGKYIFYELNASVLEEVMLWVSDLRSTSPAPCAGEPKPPCRKGGFCYEGTTEKI